MRDYIPLFFIFSDTVPVVKKGLQYQVSNPEVPATEMGAKTLKIIENLQEIFQVRTYL